MEVNKNRSFFVPMLIVGVVLLCIIGFLIFGPAFVDCRRCEGLGYVYVDSRGFPIPRSVFERTHRGGSSASILCSICDRGLH